MTYPLAFRVTGWPLKSWMAGAAFGPFMFIREGHESDEGLRQHELTHVKWAWCFALAGALIGLAAAVYFPAYLYWPVLWGALAGFIANGLAYIGIRRFRLLSEAYAYAAQMRFPDRKGGYLTLDLAAYRLALPQYDLGLSLEEAKIVLAGLRRS